MTVLSAQSIRRLCEGERPLITPLVERGVKHGKSYGLSGCSVDVRIDQGMILEPGATRLASTVEYFDLPANVCGHVIDKSSYARIFVSAFNTLLDAGWNGHLTVELVNFGNTTVFYEWGDPLCQIQFLWLDEPTVLPYSGKYQRQKRAPQPAIYEEE